MRELTDEEVFGTGGARELSDAEVFGTPAASPKKREIGASTTLPRDLGAGFAGQGNVLGLAGATPFMLADAVRGLFSGRTETGAQDAYFGRFYEPVVKDAVDFYRDAPDEQRTLGGKVGGAGGTVLSAVPAMLASGGASHTAMLPAWLANLFKGAVVAQPSFAVPSTINRAQQLTEAGVEGDDVLRASIANHLFYTGMGAAPVSAAGNMLTRAGTGAGINVVGGAAQRGTEAAILGQENARVAQPAFGVEETGTDALLGAVLAGIFGQRGRPATALPARPELSLVPPEPKPEPVPATASYDPQEAIKAVQEALFPMPDGAPAQPEGMGLIPKGAEAPAGRPPEPDVSEAPVPVAPDWTLEGGGITGGERAAKLAERAARQQARAVEQPAVVAVREGGEAIPLGADGRPLDQGSIAGKLQNDLAAQAAREAEARRAFDVAEAQRTRKVEAAEAGGRDLREARAGGTTSPEGTAATAPESFSFLDAKVEGGQMTKGEQVDVLEGGLFVKEKGQDVPASRIRKADGSDDVVADTRLTQRQRPAAPRFAQDIAGTTYAPPRGTGTQQKPRDAAQRIELPKQEQPKPGEVIRAGEEAQDAARAPVDQAEADSLAAWEASKDQTFKQSVEGDLRAMAKSAGWVEEGGKLVRNAEGKAVDRTKWIAAEWYQSMRRGLERKGLSERGEIMLAVEKYLAGDPLKANERRTVGYMLDELAAVREQSEFAGIQDMKDAQAADAALHYADMERSPQNLYDVDYLSRVDPETVERLAVQHGDDTEAFMAAVAKEADNEGNQGAARDAGAAREGSGDRAPDSQRPISRGADERGDAEGLRQQDEPAQRQGADEGEPATAARGDEAAGRNESAGQRGVAGDGSTGPGTLSANPFTNPKAIADLFKWVAGDAAAWKNSLDEVRNALGDLGREKPGAKRNALVGFVQAVFNSAAGDMRSAIKAAGNSKTANDIVNQLSDLAGEGNATKETLHSAVKGFVNKSLVDLHKLIGGIENDRDAMRQVAALVRNPDSIRPGSKIHDAAAGIRTMLADTLKYLKDAGVDIGEVKKGYFPREYDLDVVMRDPKGFIEAAQRAYRDSGMTAEAASLAAKELHDGLLYGETTSLYRADRGAAAAPFLKGRVFGKEVDQATHPLNKFLLSDPSLALAKYFERAAKRAEIARRFGDNFANWEELSRKIIDEGGGATLEKLRDFVALSAGIKKPGVSNGALRASSVMRTWGALMFLEKATLSSLTEFVVPAIRSGNVLDVGRNLKNTIADLFNKHGDDAAKRREFAEDLGLISGNISSSLASARFAGGEPVGRLESQVLDRFFKRTGLNQWTDATRVAAADNARVFIRRLAKDMAKDGKLTKRYLAELGVPAEQAADFAKFVLSKGDGMPVAGDLTGSMGDLYRTTVRKFVSQSIMDPNASSRPAWQSHPVGAIVGQLQAFNYAFFENVWKRNLRLGKAALTEADYTMMERAQMMAPLMMMPLLTAAAYAIGEGRDAIFGDPERRAKETGTEKLIKAASRGAPIAPLDPLINFVTAARYGRSAAEAFSGPVLGTFARVADAARDYLWKNSENTNTQERRAVKAAWDIFVEPAVNLMLFSFPVSAVSAAVTQAAGAGTVREKLLVEPVAGPRPPAKGSSSSGGGRDSGRSSGR